MKRLLLIFSLLFVFTCEDKKDTTPPETTITSPSSGSTVNEAVNVTCMSTDNEEVSKVELWVDGVNTGLTDDTEPYSFIWNTTTYKDGDHTLIVRGYDTSDNEGDSPPITLKVDNTISVPKGVSVQSVDFSNGGFTIKWSKSSDGDFKFYTLEHSIESQMNDYEDIFITEDVNVTNTRMENVSPLTFHYFRVTVTDTFLYKTKGSIYSTSLDPVPDSVDVDTVTYDLEKMTVEWGESKESDFSSYKLLYSKTESGNRDTLMTYTDKNTTSYSTSTYDPTIENWYWVMVTDTLGQSKIGIGKSNEIDPPPKKVNMKEVIFDFTTTPITMRVNWLDIWEEDNWDYKEHKLLYSLTENGSRDTIKTYTVKTTNNYSTTEFDPTHENWYFVEVIDHWGQSSISEGKTHNKVGPPRPVDMGSVTYNLEKMEVSWSTGSSPWFKEYRVLYSSTKDGLKDTVKIITDISPGEYSTTTFDPTKENWYFIQEFDIYGQSSISEGKTNEIDNPPTKPVLNTILYENGLFIITWKQNNDNDFLSYTLFESESDNMSAATELSTITINSDTSYNVNIGKDLIRYYQLVVEDKWGLKTESDIGVGNSRDLFAKTFGGSENDLGHSVQQTSDGGYIVAGHTYSFGNGNEFWLIKSNSNGNEEWNQTYGGAESDIGRSVQQTINGGYIITGFTYSYEGSQRVYLIKTNSVGAEEWSKTFGGSVDDGGYSVQQTTDGGYIVLGHTSSFGNGGQDIYLIKTNSEGIEAWTKTYGGSGNEFGYSVQQTSDGGYILTGNTSSYGNGDNDVWLIKTDSEGTEEWNKTFGGENDDRGYSVQQTTDGGYIIAGYTNSDLGSNDVWLIKTDANGNEQWNKTYGGDGSDYGYSVQQTTDGGYIIVGVTAPTGNGNVWLIKTATNGIEQWNKTFGGSVHDYGYSVQQTTDGGYIITGATTSFGNGGHDVWLIKTDSEGNTAKYK